ncbi:palmitoyltransferase ZDHHC20-B-like [Pollicipes pollicipes]|uniref:palmitoyltransferase ZDHHC20-B-like n=1 Tax=Pollicipes pollicipes TaxID=41117 RepID=UPI001884D1A7|nr:palmitoyltransferase ZDHHC20-B-like [Pollicipes pollicipes]XP_037088101.1 palmitoyltransferase ZDHHC20-B-like [Pollicipes pollicipes]
MAASPLMSNIVTIARKPCGVCIAITKWIPVIFILAVVCWSYYAYVVELCLVTVESYAEKVVYLMLYHILLLLFLWAYYQTVMTPIGRVPKQFRLSPADLERFEATEDSSLQIQILDKHAADGCLPTYNRTMSGTLRYCERCRLIKPDRCHHCSVCGECVLKMDHHCPWVNNCIGFANYKFFVLFLGYAFTYCVYITLSTLKYFIVFWKDGLQGMARFHILFLFFVAAMFGVSLISLLGYHCYLVLRNQSTLETFRPPIFQSGPDKRGFHMGKFNNFCEVFGDSKARWFLPVFSSLGDGVSFPQRHVDLDSDGLLGRQRWEEHLLEEDDDHDSRMGLVFTNSGAAAVPEPRPDVRLMVG